MTLLAAILLASAQGAEPPPIQLPFDIDSGALCFRNFDPELKEFGPLGLWGAGHGVCQGIAGLAAAFYLNVEFDPSGQPPTPREAREVIEKALRRHRHACTSRVRLPGYSSMAEFCRDYRRDLLHASMMYNADIALHEILAVLPKFLLIKRNPITSLADRKAEKRALDSIHEGLAQGRPQLLMHFSHVVMVYGMRYEHAPDGSASRAVLTVYNSNPGGAEEWAYAFDRDGLPALGNELIWNVTPRRWGTPCS